MFLLVLKWCFLTSGFLKNSDGKILKPIQCPPRGERERRFYETVFDPACTDPVLLKMRPLLPLYMGVYQSPMAPAGRSIRTTQPTLCMTWSCCMVTIEIGIPVSQALASLRCIPGYSDQWCTCQSRHIPSPRIPGYSVQWIPRDFCQSDFREGISDYSGIKSNRNMTCLHYIGRVWIVRSDSYWNIWGGWGFWLKYMKMVGILTNIGGGWGFWQLFTQGFHINHCISASKCGNSG